MQCQSGRSKPARVARDLDQQLDDAARTFVRGERNRFDADARTLYLSPIFDWFRGDFEQGAQTLTDFVVRYAEEPVAAQLRRGDVRIEFVDYDWSLNGR